jgi:ABC-type polysaccharide/polyol phosphate transport system ATPase subunit
MTDHGLPSDVVLSVERLGKRYSPVHTSRYTPAQSLFSRLFDRGDAVLADMDAGVDGAEDDDEDDSEDEGDEADVGGLPGGDSDFSELSFRVARGEAVGIIATPRPAAAMVAYVLAGMTSPSTGRAVVRGRAGPTVRFATALVGRDLRPRRAATVLARLMGVPVSERDVYIDEVLRLALPDTGEARGLPPRAVMRRLAVSAALDPLADLLILDELPPIGSREFRLRCIERLEERLGDGASAVIAVNDAQLIRRLCRECIWLDNGRPALVGPPDDVLAACQHRTGAPPRARFGGFNQDAAMLTVTTSSRSGRAEVRIALETAAQSTVLAPKLVLTDEHGETFELAGSSEVVLRPGRLEITATVSAGGIPAGRYSGQVVVDVVVGRRQSTIVRELEAPIAIGEPTSQIVDAVSWHYDDGAVVEHPAAVPQA